MPVPSSQLGRELRRSAGLPFPPPAPRMCKGITRRGHDPENGERELRFSLPALPLEPMGAVPIV